MSPGATKVIIAAAIIAAVGALYLYRSANTISGTEAKRLVADGALLVDVRTPVECREGLMIDWPRIGEVRYDHVELPRRLGRAELR